MTLLPYILVSLVMVSYFEILGQYILYKLKNDNYIISFWIGFIITMAYGYVTTSLVSALNGPFFLLLIIYGVYFVSSILFIIKDRKKFKMKYNTLYYFISTILIAVLLCYTYNTGLGATHGFDTLFYTNLISNNSSSSILNNFNIYLGSGLSRKIPYAYTFQSYYYFCVVIIFLVKPVLNFIGFDVNNLDLIVWIFQIVFDYFLISLLINVLEKYAKKRYLLHLLFVLVFVFYYGKIYFNNIYGFFGNSFRTIAIGYSMLCLYELTKNYSFENKVLFGTCIIGSCAFSSSSLFIIVFILFGSLFVLIEKDKNIFKYYSIIALFPLIDLLSVVSRKIYIGIIGSIIVCLLLYLFNDIFYKILKNKKVRYWLIALCSLTMFVLSYKTSGMVCNLQGFTNNASEVADMTINYFSFSFISKYVRNRYCILVWILLLGNIIFNQKEDIIKVISILIVVIFNPFCFSYLQKLDLVFYRAYDLAINPFTIILFASLLLDKIKNKYIYYILVATCIIWFGSSVNFKTPDLYHESFEIDENYNKQYKMSNDQIDIINVLKTKINFDGLDNPYILTDNVFTQCNIPSGKYIYGRVMSTLDSWNEAELQCFKIFYPVDCYGDPRTPEGADYKNIKKYLIESGIDYLVVNKSLIYHNEENDTFYSIDELVGAYFYSYYENDGYTIYCIRDFR